MADGVHKKPHPANDETDLAKDHARSSKIVESEMFIRPDRRGG
jgi:hypothetical protein